MASNPTSGSKPKREVIDQDVERGVKSISVTGTVLLAVELLFCYRIESPLQFDLLQIQNRIVGVVDCEYLFPFAQLPDCVRKAWVSSRGDGVGGILMSLLSVCGCCQIKKNGTVARGNG